MSDELWALLREAAAVHRLIRQLILSDEASTTTPEQEREYHLRRAALAQRHLARADDPDCDPVEAAADAEQTAVLLWKHDALHHSHRGPLPASAPVWKISGLHEYVRQEVDAGPREGQQ